MPNTRSIRNMMRQLRNDLCEAKRNNEDTTPLFAQLNVLRTMLGLAVLFQYENDDEKKTNLQIDMGIADCNAYLNNVSLD